MVKDSRFPGQPVLGQVLKLIPRSLVAREARQHGTDRYYKRFKTYEHVITMVYALLSHANCLREVTTGMLAAGSRLNHLGLQCFPRRSTLSDANRSRSHEVFGAIYNSLYRYYQAGLPDSHPKNKLLKRVKLVDSTTIQLFSEVIRGAGQAPVSGRKKGGIKVHTMLSAKEDVPHFVCFSSGPSNDSPFLNKMQVKPGDIVVFDRGYNNYLRYHNYTQQGVWFVTRPHVRASYEVLEDIAIASLSDPGVIKDQIIRIRLKDSSKTVRLRKIEYQSEEQEKPLIFWTNIFFLNADRVSKLYKHRWQIELLFKRLKQNYPLRYFLGDNPNAIKIQIWSALIAHLLVKVIMGAVKRKWSFSNLSAMIRHHLFTYIDLTGFLEDPERALQRKQIGLAEPQLFPT